MEWSRCRHLLMTRHRHHHHLHLHLYLYPHLHLVRPRSSSKLQWMVQRQRKRQRQRRGRGLGISLSHSCHMFLLEPSAVSHAPSCNGQTCQHSHPRTSLLLHQTGVRPLPQFRLLCGDKSGICLMLDYLMVLAVLAVIQLVAHYETKT